MFVSAPPASTGTADACHWEKSVLENVDSDKDVLPFIPTISEHLALGLTKSDRKEDMAMTLVVH